MPRSRSSIDRKRKAKKKRSELSLVASFETDQAFSYSCLEPVSWIAQAWQFSKGNGAAILPYGGQQWHDYQSPKALYGECGDARTNIPIKRHGFIIIFHNYAVILCGVQPCPSSCRAIQINTIDGGAPSQAPLCCVCRSLSSYLRRWWSRSKYILVNPFLNLYLPLEPSNGS